MLNVKKLPRVFVHTHEGTRIRLDDPNENLSPEGVCNHYAGLYAILTTAKISGPVIRDDHQEFEFVSTIGTKG